MKMEEKCSECRRYFLSSLLSTCLRCYESLCFSCADRHKRNNSDHRFTFPVLNIYSTLCNRHYQSFEGYCYTCNELVCRLCIQGSHNFHNIWSIEDAAKEKRAQITKETEQVKNVSQLLEKQIEVRTLNYEKVMKDIELVDNDLTKYSRNIATLIDEKKKGAKVLLVSTKNELSAYLRDLKPILAVNTEMERNLRKLSSTEYGEAGFICGVNQYMVYSKYYQVELPKQINEQYVPLSVVYQKIEEEKIKKLIPDISLRRGFQRVEKAYLTDERTGPTEPPNVKCNHETIITNLQNELELKEQDVKSVQNILKQISMNTRRLVELGYNEHDSITIKQPGSMPTHAEINKQIESIYKDMKDIQKLVKSDTSKEVTRLEADVKEWQDQVTKQHLESKEIVQRQKDEIKQSQKRVAELEQRIQFQTSATGIGKLNDNLLELQNRYDALNKDNDSMKQQIKWIESEKEDLKSRTLNEVTRLKAEVKEWQDQVTKQHLESEKIVQRQNAEINQWQKRVAELQHRIQFQTSAADIGKLKDNLIEQQNRYDALSKENDSMKRQIKRIESEKEDLKSRLSQVAGAKLTAGNSSITDLGDRYRPTRIAEMYSELYDTDWTEAMDDLSNTWSEELVVQHMFIVLQECFNTCKYIAREQMKGLYKNLFPDIQDKDLENYLDSHVTELKQLKDARKGTAVVVGKTMVKNLYDHDVFKNKCSRYQGVQEPLINKITKTSYGTQCVIVCWFMVVQDPEMYLDDSLNRGDPFNKDLYKEYTKSGKKVAYNVWPALYLHKDGPLLTKGVAQAY